MNSFADMNLLEVNIEIRQKYSSRSVNLMNENGNYLLVYVCDSSISPRVDTYQRELSAVEAKWIEKQVEATVNNPDLTTWHSLVGGDKLTVVVKRNNGNDIYLREIEPIKKYLDLQTEIESLAQYGSNIL